MLALSGLSLFPAHGPVLSTQKVLKVCLLEEMASFFGVQRQGLVREAELSFVASFSAKYYRAAGVLIGF